VGNDYIFMTAVVYLALFLLWATYIWRTVKKGVDNWVYDIAFTIFFTALVVFVLSDLVFTRQQAAVFSIVFGFFTGGFLLLWSIQPPSKTKDPKEEDGD